MDDSQILQIKKRATAYAYRLLGNKQDAEDYGQLACIEALEANRRTGITNFKISWLVTNCLRRDLGSVGSDRSKFNMAMRAAKGFQPRIEGDEFSSNQFISEEHFRAPEPEPSVVDLQLLERCDASLISDQSARSEASNRGVTESTVYQMRTVQREKLARAYLWEHYKEYGIESELEIEWL